MADFGLAERIEASDGSGFEKTRFDGTPCYMAPEIHLKKPFSGQAADLFALAVIIFTLHTGHLPFHTARESDPLYRHIVRGSVEDFWRTHIRNNAGVYFSESFMDLMTSMLAFQPYMRPSLADVAAHPWVRSGPVSTEEETNTEMQTRYLMLQL